MIDSRGFVVGALMALGACGGSAHDPVDAPAMEDAPPSRDAAIPTSPWIDRTPSPIPAAWPPNRGRHGMVYDAMRDKIVIFGGHDIQGSPDFDDLWEWDGSTGIWTDRTPSTLPTAWPRGRSASVMAYDASRDRTVLFGGYALSSVTGAFVDVWEWDGHTGTWTDRTPSPLPAAWPSPEWLQYGVYDSDRHVLVMYDSGKNTWEWDGATGTFTDRTPSPLPAAWPSARLDPSLAFDATAHRVVLFGGQLQHVGMNDAWTWDGTVWNDITPSPLPATWPTVRSAGQLAFDSVRNALTLFGGVDFAGGPQATFIDDLHDLTLDTTTWTDRTPVALPQAWPAARVGAGFVYDPALHHIVLAGGFIVPGFEVWELAL